MSVVRSNTSPFPRIQGAKCVVVGDESVGKSSLITTFTTKCFPSKVDSLSLFDKSNMHVPFGESVVNLEIWDLPAQDSYGKLRALSYSQCDVFIICFSIASPPTFENVFRTWYMELARVAPDVPIILVGCKSDLRRNESTIQRLKEHEMKPISSKQAQRLTTQLGAQCYVECSAFTMDRVDSAFEEACRVALLNRASAPRSNLVCSTPVIPTTSYGSLRFKNINLPFNDLMDESIPSTTFEVTRQRALSVSENNKKSRREKRKKHKSMKIGAGSDAANTIQEQVPSSKKPRKESCVIC